MKVFYIQKTFTISPHIFFIQKSFSIFRIIFCIQKILTPTLDGSKPKVVQLTLLGRYAAVSREKADFSYRDPESGIALMGVHRSSHVFPKHSHETYYIIGLMDQGETYCYGPEKEETLAGAGSFFIINPGQVHSGVPVSGDPVSYRMISINAAKFCSIAEEIEEGSPSPPEFPLTFTGRPEEQAAMNRAYGRIQKAKEDIAGDLGKDETVFALIGQLLLRAERDRPLRQPPFYDHPGLSRGAEFLSSALDSKLSLADAASAAGMSSYHFIRAFRKAYGVSPHAYRTQKRIGMAKSLLRQGLTPTETALSMGFYDQSHFTNTFHAYTGLSPGDYLKGTIRH